jgi:hypothetical protein
MLAVIRKLFYWFELPHKGFRLPIIRGMRRDRPAQRERVLDDAELRLIW